MTCLPTRHVWGTMTKTIRIAPSNPQDRTRDETPYRSKESLGFDPSNGAETFILRRTEGAKPPEDRSHLLEYHTCHEQSFLLMGNASFAGWYDWHSPGFMTHPPYWWHPSGYTFTGAGMTLVKIDKPVDFIFTPVPDGWDGLEWFADEKDHECKNRVIANAHLGSVPWEPVLLPDGSPAGFDAKHVWDDVETGWTTWWMRAPAGWTGRPEWTGAAGGDEIYILEGSLSLAGQNVALGQGGYLYDPEVIVVGAADSSTTTGFSAVRWSKHGNLWTLPENHLPARS